MKLLIYSHFFWPSVGGVETVVQSLANGLANLRDSNGKAIYEITVVTNTSLAETAEPERPYPVIRQPSRSELRQLIRSSDVVHVAGAAILPICSALRAGKPIVTEHHGFQAICPTGQLIKEPEDVPCPAHFMNGNHVECLRCRRSGSFVVSFRLWLLTFVRRYLCRHVSANIVPTLWLGEQLRLPRTKTVPHGLTPQPALVRIDVAEHIPRIVFVGRLVATKGVRLLLQAVHKLREQGFNPEVVVIGSGPEQKSLEAVANETQLASRARFLGRLRNDEIVDHLAQATVVVVPSIGGEVFGMVVAESMLRGLPVIASDIGAFVEVLGSPVQTFRTGDADDLARQLARIFRDPTMAADWAKAGRRRILDMFTEQRMLEGHDRVYQEVARLAHGAR
jgi:glycosyltransferase involved in cell wall biosynthesis